MTRRLPPIRRTGASPFDGGDSALRAGGAKASDRRAGWGGRVDEWRRATWMWAPAALAFVLWLALPRPGVWLDEAATVSATSRTWPELLRLVHHQDASLSGYYAVVWAVSHVIGVDPLAASRLVGGLSYVTATLVVTLIGRRLGPPRIALLAGCTFAILPSTSASAVNARPEALACALVAGVYLAAVSGRRVLQCALGLAACAVYALDVLYLPLAMLLLLTVSTARQGDSQRNRHPLVAAAAALPRSAWSATVLSSGLGAAWLLACSRQQAQVSWIHTSVPGDLFSSLARVGFTAPLSRAHEQPALTCSIALGIAAFLIALVAFAQPRRRSGGRGRVALLWCLSIVPPLIASAAVALGKDIFVERYFTPSSIGIALAVACALAPLARRVLTALAAVVVMLAAPVWWASHRPDGHWGENLAVHEKAVAGARQVWFVAPRNRAALFSSGTLPPRWHDADWWARARTDGTLWGPGTPTPGGVQRDLLVVTDTRRVAALPSVPGCGRPVVVTREARATTVRLECSATREPRAR